MSLARTRWRADRTGRFVPGRLAARRPRRRPGSPSGQRIGEILGVGQIGPLLSACAEVSLDPCRGAAGRGSRRRRPGRSSRVRGGVSGSAAHALPRARFAHLPLRHRGRSRSRAIRMPFRPCEPSVRLVPRDEDVPRRREKMEERRGNLRGAFHPRGRRGPAASTTAPIPTNIPSEIVAIGLPSADGAKARRGNGSQPTARIANSTARSQRGRSRP